MERISTVEKFQEITSTEQPVIVKFTAGWCPDCHFIDPFMPEVAQKFSSFTFVKVDRDQFIDLCIELDVFGIPSFIAFENGAELGRFVSKDRKTQEQIEQFIAGLK